MSVNNILSSESVARQIPVQPFFAEAFDIPAEVAVQIFKKLYDHELANAREVSYWWNEVISDSSQLKNRLIVRTCIINPRYQQVTKIS